MSNNLRAQESVHSAQNKINEMTFDLRKKKSSAGHNNGSLHFFYMDRNDYDMQW